ncbi:TM2 domain-containing protein [Vibrio kanaloae]|uniref:TM2 domain-containing protein n=1 Tax=Vibrio kanaloae TaxID=170673 RepID=UPI0035A60837
MSLVKCYGCESDIHPSAVACPKCGAVQESSTISDQNAWLVLACCFFGGVLGAHHFVVGRWKMGLLYLLTLGVFFIGAFIDFFGIIFGWMTDSKGRKIKF